MGKLISIIVPVFRVEKYLQRCLDSISKQSYNELEVILIDDGSDDNSAHICDKMAEKDARFRVVHQENQGVSSARNKGVTLSNGDYILYVDADDWLEENCCEMCVEEIVKTNADICFFEMFINYPAKQIKTSVLDLHSCLEFDESLRHRLLCATIPFRNMDTEQDMVFYGPYCKLMKKSVVHNQVFDENLKYGEDAIYNFSIIKKIRNVCFVKEPLYNYRKHDQSATSNFGIDRNKQSIVRLQKTYDLIKDDLMDVEGIVKCFDEMFINISLVLLNELFVGKKLFFEQAWREFVLLSNNSWMLSMWHEIKKRNRNIRVLTMMYSGNKMFQMIVFAKLRYFS